LIGFVDKTFEEVRILTKSVSSLPISTNFPDDLLCRRHHVQVSDKGNVAPFVTELVHQPLKGMRNKFDYHLLRFKIVTDPSQSPIHIHQAQLEEMKTTYCVSITINKNHHSELFTINAQTEKLQPFGVLLLCVLNLDHMCQRSSLGLGCQVFAPGMLICPQKNMLFCRRAAPNFVVPQQTIQRKAPIRMTSHNQQLLTKNKQIG
jgi:hypothetical protein